MKSSSLVAFLTIAAIASPRFGIPQTRFAVIGDYGADTTAEADVSNLVKSWNPEFIVTTGDNNYDAGLSSTIDANIGKHYHEFIYPYLGAYGAGATENRFWPSPGNHDWGNLADNPNGLNPYIGYFGLPNNERYYEFARGSVRFFILDSDQNEPDGTAANSAQGAWLQLRLAASIEPWKIVVFHHPPYSSGEHGSSTYMRWPFAQWGASIVLSGHDHNYERLLSNGLTYFVNGLGGKSIRAFGTLLPQSVFRYNGDYGAQRGFAWATAIRLEFVNLLSELIDSFTLSIPPPPPTSLHAKVTRAKSVELQWSAPAIPDPLTYRVYRRLAFRSTFAQIGETSSTTFIDPYPPVFGKFVYYAVRSIGPTGTVGPMSAICRVPIR